MKCYLQRHQNMFITVAKTREAAVQASCIISHVVANKLKLLTDGEYMKECITKAAEMLCPRHIFFKIPVFLQIRWSKI
jgi:hypothetical protein